MSVTYFLKYDRYYVRKIFKLLISFNNVCIISKVKEILCKVKEVFLQFFFNMAKLRYFFTISLFIYLVIF